MRNIVKIATIQPDHRIQLPAEWVQELSFHGLATMEKSGDGIFVRPCLNATWDEVFADKLPVGSSIAAFDPSEVSGDDYIF
jgi:hypothetical protein